MNLAVKEFISKPHTIELEPIETEEWDKIMKKAYKKHKKAMDDMTEERLLIYYLNHFIYHFSYAKIILCTQLKKI